MYSFMILTLLQVVCDIPKISKPLSKLVPQSLQEIFLCNIQSLQDKVNHTALGHSSLIITYREIENCACDIIISVCACDAVYMHKQLNNTLAMYVNYFC